MLIESLMTSVNNPKKKHLRERFHTDKKVNVLAARKVFGNFSQPLANIHFTHYNFSPLITLQRHT